MFVRCAIVRQFSESERAGCSQTAGIAIAACEHGHWSRCGCSGGEPVAVAMQCGPYLRCCCSSERARDGTVKAGSRVHSSGSTSRDSRPGVGSVSEV
jgi:hypothetical protein